MASRRQVRYSPLPVDETDDDYHDPRFEYRPGAFDKVPWKSITLALFLLFLGSLLLFLSFFILTGHMGGEKSQGYGLLALGILAFLPGLVFSIGFSSLPISCLILTGFYETRIAYYSWRGAKGYRFASIPSY